MAQYTLTGYDASAHMSEETHKASRSAAVGMVWAVIVSVIAGFVLLVAITFAIPNRRAQTQPTYIMTYIWHTSMGTHWAEVLLFIVVVRPVLLPDGACITSGSRMMFAFSRDRAVPGHQVVAQGLTPPRAGVAAVGDGDARLPAAVADVLE